MTSNNIERPVPKLDESYINNYQTYVKQKSGFESFLHGTSTPSTETKIVNDPYKNNECKICAVIGKQGDLPRVLNQGLYYKYTSSQDFFYTKDITGILEKKRQPASIRYYDDLAYDDDREHLKAVFKTKDSRTLMNEIKEFYSQFYLFPRNFQKPYFRILNSNIAKHRRIEYVRVFQNSSPRETTRTRNNDDVGLNFLHMLGETFLRDNYKETSTLGERYSERRSGIRRETEQYLKEMETNFNVLRNTERQRMEDESNKFSNALYNKQYMLYSRNDSETAEEYLRNVLHEFKIAENNLKTKIKEVKVVKVEPEKKNARDQKKIVSRSRPQSPTTSLSLRKFQSEHTSILKDIMKDAENGKQNELDYLPDKVTANEIKTTREILSGETSHRLTRPESVTNLHQNRSHHGNPHRKEPKGTNLISTKFTPDNLHEAVYDRESIMNQVSHLRTSQSKAATNYRSEEKKSHVPIDIVYKPSPVYEDGSSTATSKQVKVSYINSPSGFRSHSSLETLIMKKNEEKPSKVPLIRPEVVIPNPYSREPKIILKRGDSLVGFDSTKSNRSKDSKSGADSSISRKVLKSTKSNPRSFIRQLERESAYDSRGPADVISLKKALNGIEYQSVKKPYFEHEIPEMVQKIVPSMKHVRSVSSGIKKLRFEVVPDWKREDALRKGNITILGNHQNISASYRSGGPSVDNYNSAKFREEHRNSECQRIAEIYSQATNLRRRKAKSSANILIHPTSFSKADASGKESKRSVDVDAEASGITERKKFAFKDIKDLVEVFTPKIHKNLSSKDKSPIKVQPNKVSKHQRYASRG